MDVGVSKEGVAKLLKGLNPSKALESDVLHSRVKKERTTELGPVLPIFSNSILTHVKSPKSGLLQIYVLYIRRVTELSYVINVPFL